MERGQIRQLDKEIKNLKERVRERGREKEREREGEGERKREREREVIDFGCDTMRILCSIIGKRSEPAKSSEYGILPCIKHIMDRHMP